MRKFILASTIILASSAYADDFNIKLLGGFDFQAGYLKSNAPSSNPKDAKAKPNFVSENQKNYAFSTSAYTAVEAKNTLDSGIIYGTKIGLDTTTKTSRKHQSSIFIETEEGRLELGSDKSAMSKMRITPFSIAAATAGLWDVWVKGDPLGTPDNQIPYAMNFTNFLDSKMRLPNKVEYSRKVTYYTPEYKGIQIGISYIPDSANVGYSKIKDTNVKHKPIYADYYYAVKNGFAGGLTYTGKIADLSLKLAAVGEMGKVIATPKAINQDTDTETPKAEAKLPTKFRKLKNYTIGAQVEYKDLSLAASYGDYMRSFISTSEPDPSTEIYGFGAAYKFDKLKTSITYFGSTHRKNAISATTLAVDYKLAPGLLPYAEVTTFNAKGRHINTTETKKSHKGFLVLTGAKIEF